jgi:hypothetical protein
MSIVQCVVCSKAAERQVEMDQLVGQGAGENWYTQAGAAGR